MARTQTMVQLTDDLVRALDAEAGRRRMSRSALIREILAAAVGDAHDAVVTDAIVAGYRRIPPATPDEWSGLEDLGDRSSLETLHRLDAEERREGAGW